MGMIETVKEVAELVQKSDNIDLVRKILTLQQEVMEQQEEARSLRGRVSELEELLSQHRKLTFRDNTYWDDESGAGPFCSGCWDSKKKLVHLHDYSDILLDCPGCKWRGRKPGASRLPNI